MASSRTLRLLLTLPHLLPWLAVPLLVLGLLLVGVLDVVTGPDFSFSLFYYLWATLAALILGFRKGLAFAALVVVVWTAMASFSGRTSPSWLSFAWAELARMGTLALLVFLVSRFQSAMTELSLHALKDPLTGASNRRHFDDFFERTLRVSRRYDRPLTVVSFDIDNFKQINDTRGHAAGDAVLRSLVDEIQKRIRPEDLLARLGGDEFVLLLPDTDYASAQALLSRVFDAVHESFRADARGASLSIGAVSFERVPEEVAPALERADALLYRAKRSGKQTLIHETA